MKHFKSEVVFEAWDEEDAGRVLQRMLRPVDEERRLVLATDPVETLEYLGAPPVDDPREVPVQEALPPS